MGLLLALLITLGTSLFGSDSSNIKSFESKKDNTENSISGHTVEELGA